MTSNARSIAKFLNGRVLSNEPERVKARHRRIVSALAAHHPLTLFHVKQRRTGSGARAKLTIG
jgi:hypothetical protein